MYGYEEFIEITPEQVLQKISQQKIFEWILEEPFSYSLRYLSPFREDNKAGCRFEEKEDGTILFVDFGEKLLTGRTHRSCFRMVMDKYHCDLTTSVKTICQHFNLPLNKSEYKEIVTPEYTKKTSETRASITYVPKQFNKFDIQYWSQFLIRPEHLKEDNVFSAARYTISSTKGVKTFTPYKHCYVIDFIDRVKIYQPYESEYRFITNCDEDNIGNIDNLPPTGEELIVQKSYKDHRVLRNTIPSLLVVWFQNEGCIPSEELCWMMIKRFNLITFFYDNDEDGIMAAIKLTEYFNSLKPGSARMVHIPEDVPHKDPSAFISKEGRIELIELLKYIEVWKIK